MGSGNKVFQGNCGKNVKIDLVQFGLKYEDAGECKGWHTQNKLARIMILKLDVAVVIFVFMVYSGDDIKIVISTN